MEDGTPYRIYARIENKLRIPEHHIKSSFYVYQSLVYAKAGTGGASGFFVSVISPHKRYVYAVTNKHVIGDAQKPTLRLNLKQGGFDYLETYGWTPHKMGDDISICQIEIPDKFDFECIEYSEFISQLDLERDKGNLGPGDPTYMIGRFLKHEGQISNTPIARFGTIALNPSNDEKIYNSATKNEDEVFLIESKSISGYSGSAVFGYIFHNEDRAKDTPKQYAIGGPDIPMKFLLGINIGNTPHLEPTRVEDDDKPFEEWRIHEEGSRQVMYSYNSGIMRIAPAWKLLEMLNYEEFEDMRKKEDKKQVDTHKKNDYAVDSISVDKSVFDKTLKKVSRKTKPSQPGSSKTKT
ncbi:MAG TPA: hypothetical protein VLE99_00065 [Candidatus Saccharimonadales bacterium]|nr:hypothetical protein [Candidatus Saccharimonadales bacterium]